jgi:hypothetical protein
MACHRCMLEVGRGEEFCGYCGEDIVHWRMKYRWLLYVLFIFLIALLLYFFYYLFSLIPF